MQLNPIALAIPVFFAAIGVEIWVARRRGLTAHRFADVVGDLGCGIGNQVNALLFGALLLSAYSAVHQRWSLISFEPGSVWPWVIAFVGVDFLYYWWHRFSHEVNALWAAHVVHHQSEDYNLAVALRQAWFTSFTVLPFYLPLALLGVPPLAYAISAAVSLLYQFWIHTELIGRLPAPLEWVLNTPSHHRVHHATNPQYLDRNYGAILIVWDRLFGTFEPEREPCVYGITVPLRSVNPVWANFHYWVDLAAQARTAPGILTKVAVFFARPGWDPLTRTVKLPPHVSRERFVKYAPPPVSTPVQLWIALQLVLLAVGLMALLLYAPGLPPQVVIAASAFIVLATVAWSGILEHRGWAWPTEAVRVVGSICIIGWALVA